MIPVTNSSVPAKVTAGTTAKTLKALLGVQIPDGIDAVEIYADGGDIRYTMNEGLTPSATVGFVLADGQTRVFEGITVDQLKLYAAADVTVQVQLGKRA
jgi:hypothetical protein